ncbi:alpha/beta hydrolase family protein [Nonomuraea sp. GTA35]|uniref:alpha/beta hydrolase family protein n=1 Tax=Nonomuraea sp. GTA35 TaxID=1676746 RepID=UPI0035C0F4D4
MSGCPRRPRSRCRSWSSCTAARGVPACATIRGRTPAAPRPPTPQAPPFLLLHGAGDTLIPCDQSVRLATALRQAGVPAELHLVEQADHLWVGADEAAVEECFARTLAFAAARAHLGPRP